MNVFANFSYSPHHEGAEDQPGLEAQVVVDDKGLYFVVALGYAASPTAYRQDCPPFRTSNTSQILPISRVNLSTCHSLAAGSSLRIMVSVSRDSFH